MRITSGGERTATGATHALTHPGGGELIEREHTRQALPVTHAPERCLLDHGAELQRALVATTEMHVAVDVPAAAAALAPDRTDRASPQPCGARARRQPPRWSPGDAPRVTSSKGMSARISAARSMPATSPSFAPPARAPSGAAR
jgi:hypothetical protein